MKQQIINGSYGMHERNKFDLYLAKSKSPTPLVVFIHGGGFAFGNKEDFDSADKEKCLENGISFATINYPYTNQKTLPDILKDIARAIQYFKNMHQQYNIDKDKVCCYGVSAGAGSSLFLASKPDLCDNENIDPVLRESTKIFAAGLYETQSTYDFYKWPQLLGLPIEQLFEVQKEMGDPVSIAYGKAITEIDDFLDDDVVGIRKFLDMQADLSTSNTPIYIKSSVSKTDTEDILHAQVFSQTVYDICKQNNIKVELTTPEEKSTNPDFISFLLKLLR